MVFFIQEYILSGRKHLENLWRTDLNILSSTASPFSADRGPWGSRETFPDQQNLSPSAPHACTIGPSLEFLFKAHKIWISYLALKTQKFWWQMFWRATELLPRSMRWIFQLERVPVHTMDGSLRAILDWFRSLALHLNISIQTTPLFVKSRSSSVLTKACFKWKRWVDCALIANNIIVRFEFAMLFYTNISIGHLQNGCF